MTRALSAASSSTEPAPSPDPVRLPVGRKAKPRSNVGAGARAGSPPAYAVASAHASAAGTILSCVAAGVLGISTETLRRLVKAGKIAGVLIRNRWRFDPRELALYRRFGPLMGRVHHVARALGVHGNTVRAWERQGLLRAVRRGQGQRWFNREDVIRLAQARARRGKVVGDFCPWCGERGGLSRGLALGRKGTTE